MSAPTCPECAHGKHQNCNGQAWDDVTDDTTACACSCGACRCWTVTAAIGHEGHCCFLIDNRAGKPMQACWRSDEDVCHVPPSSNPEPERNPA